MSNDGLLSVSEIADILNSSTTHTDDELSSAIIEQTEELINTAETGELIKETNTPSSERLKEEFDKGFKEGYAKANYDLIGKCVDNVSMIQNK